MNDPPKHLPADERRAVTVEAVIALAGTQNPADITTAAIAKHMQLTQGALFRHFPSKEALWKAVMEWVADRLLARIERASSGAPSTLAALEAMFLAHAGFVADHPGVPRMIFAELQRAEPTPSRAIVEQLLTRYRERLARLLTAGIEARELRPDLDKAATATLFIGSLQGLVMQSLLAGDVKRVRREAPRVFSLLRVSIER